MFSITTGPFTLLCQSDGLPDLYPEYVQHAHLADEIDLDGRDGGTCFVAVQHAFDWPFLVIAQRFSPAVAGFHPGAIIVEESGLLLVGAGTRLLAYQLNPPARLWQDEADTGFWGWNRHDTFLLMAAELELAAWDLQGRKLWTSFVEPPWTYTVENGVVRLDIMGEISSFPLATGPGT